MPFVVKMALVVSLIFYGTAARAGVFDHLPFFGDKHVFAIFLEGDRTLASDLKHQISQERADSSARRQLNDPQAIGRYEADLLKRYLRSKGFYDATVSWELAEHLIYRPIPGPIYLIRDLTFDLPAVEPLLDRNQLGLSLGQPLDAAVVLAALGKIEGHYHEHSCLYEIKTRYDAQVNHTTHEASLHIALEPSVNATFGQSKFTGNVHIAEGHLANYLSFEPGGCFRRKLLDESRLALLQSGLLASTDIDTTLTEQSSVDMLFRVTERHPHTVKGGVSYDGDAGLGLALGREHRNLLKHGEKLTITGDFSKLESKIDAQLTMPHFLAKSQNLVWHTNLDRKNSEAFTASKADLGVGINRKLTPFITLGAGVETLFSRVQDAAKQEDYGLLGLPFTADINHRDNIFDPRTGWNIGVKTESFWDAYHTNIGFQKSTLAGSYYFTKDTWPSHPTLALRLAGGAIIGEALDLVPADERFYVGGGGSVRGYTYQSLGVLVDNKPTGGMSFGETSAELRLRLARSWGLVLFVDGGLAYADKAPPWGRDFLWGAGLGVRYYTAFAPIRFDVATPINRRPGVDDPVQVYVSIGQAF